MLIKNSILRYLHSAATFDAESDRRAAVEAQRAAIAGNVTNANEVDPNANPDPASPEVDPTDPEPDPAEVDPDADLEPAPVDETAEEKAARVTQEKEDRKQARIEKRIGKLVAANELTKKENEDLRKQLDAKKVEGLTEEEVNARAKKLAEDMVRERETANTQKQFEKDCDKLADEALKIDPKFNNKVQEMAAEVAPIPMNMIGILADLDNENGGAVLNYLADNVDEYDDIHTLSEGRMTAKLIRISDKLKAAAEKAAAEAKEKAKKKKSDAPNPIIPVNEGRDTRTANALPNNPTKNMEEYVRIRNEQDAAMRKARGF
jgi:hypothetical protein